jgi:hypothetical protein
MGLEMVDIMTQEYASINASLISFSDFGGSSIVSIDKSKIEIEHISGKAVGLYASDGSVQATDYMEAPVFKGDLNGMATKAGAIEWIYF